MSRFGLVVVCALAVGCGSSDPGTGGGGGNGGDDVAQSNAAQACDNYITAATDCYAQAGVGAPIDSSFCSDYDGLTGEAARDAAELFQCYADVMDSGDCSDQIAASETFQDISTCVQ